MTRKFGERLVLGMEVDRQGADTDDGQASTSLGLGGIYQIAGPFRLLASGGPKLEDRGETIGYQAYVGLGLDF